MTSDHTIALSPQTEPKGIMGMDVKPCNEFSVIVSEAVRSSILIDAASRSFACPPSIRFSQISWRKLLPFLRHFIHLAARSLSHRSLFGSFLRKDFSHGGEEP